MAAPRVSLAVQHHPSRPEALRRLLDALAPAHAEVVSDPDPTGPRNAWRTYKPALEATPADATHRVILQDDTIPVPGFAEVAGRAIAARPDNLLAFFVGEHPYRTSLLVRRAGDRGERWAAADPAHWIPTVALCWPAATAADFLAWDAAANYPREFTADDERVGRYVRASGIECLVTVPNLVEHPDDVASVGRRQAPCGRTSCCPPPDGCDLLALDWS